MSVALKSSVIDDTAMARSAVAALSMGRLDDAIESLAALVAAHVFPTIAAVLVADTARRCGRFDVMALHQPVFDAVLDGTEFHALHASQAQTIMARRGAVTFPPSVEGLNLEALRTFGRAAIECHHWHFGVAAWSEYLNRGGDVREGVRRLAQSYTGLGMHHEAIAYFTEAMRLAPNDQMMLKLDRSKRLEQRKRDAFSKHAGRFKELAVLDAVRMALPGLALRAPTLASALHADLAGLSAAIGVRLAPLPLAEVGVTESSAATSPLLSFHDVVSAASNLRQGRMTSVEIDRLPLFAAMSVRDALLDITFPTPGAAIEHLLATPFDTILLTLNDAATDTLALRTIDSAASMGRRVLCVGMRPASEPVEYQTSTLPNGVPVLLLPNLGQPIVDALLRRQLPATEMAPQIELCLAATAQLVASLATSLRCHGDVVLATQEYAGIYIGGLVRAGGGVTWTHDVTDLLHDGDALDAELRMAARNWEAQFIRSTDYLSAPSEAVREALATTYGVAAQTRADHAPAVGSSLATQNSDSAGASLPDRDAAFFADRLDPAIGESLPLFAARDIRHVLYAVDYPAPTDEVRNLLASTGFDTVMFVANGFSMDPRVVKTAQAVAISGRKVLAVGLRGNNEPQDYQVDALDGGIPLIRLPNMNRPYNIAMRKLKLSTAERAPRSELWLAAMALMLGSIMREVQRPGRDLVLHTHDYHGLYVGGLTFLTGGTRRGARWFHDAHEFIRAYDIIDPQLQAAGTAWEERFIHDVDTLSTVSEELGNCLQSTYCLKTPPAIIYNTNSLSNRFRYRGQTAKEKLGLQDKRLLVHSGNVTNGRGVEHIVKALGYLPDAFLLLITESKNAYVDGIIDLAKQSGVRDRLIFHPYLPHDEVMGFVADADAGMITPDRYGNAEVGLANKLFDYVMANVPVVSSDTNAMRRYLTEWPIGELFTASDAQSLATAVGRVLADPQRYKRANLARMDKVLASSWEAQVARIHQMYGTRD